MSLEGPEWVIHVFVFLGTYKFKLLNAIMCSAYISQCKPLSTCIPNIENA
jgi:hypothetical protein